MKERKEAARGIPRIEKEVRYEIHPAREIESEGGAPQAAGRGDASSAWRMASQVARVAVAKFSWKI